MKFNKTLLIALFLAIGLLNAGRAQALTFYQFSFIKLLPGLNLNISMIPRTILTKMSFGYNLTSSRWCQDSTVECKQELNLSNNRCDTTYSLCVSMQQGTEAGCQYVKEKCLANNQKVYDECINRYVSNENRCWLTLPAKSCDDSDTKACNTVTGAPGTQTADYCNTVTGEWVWGECVANPPPPPPLPPSNNCVPLSPETQTLSCPSGQTGSITQQRTSSCPGPAWSAWTTVSNTCTSPGSSCPALDPDYRVCVMADGRYGREYTDYCNEQTGEWVWRPCNVYPALQPVCTSFTYSAWSACSSGEQTRSITAREPYGCAGGDPVTLQSCTVPCQGTAPSCGLGYVGSYVCQNGTWVNQCQVACSQPPPACATGWTGSYSCMPTSGGYIWMNTCVPPGTPGCMKGVAYIQSGADIWVKCVGGGYTVNGLTCYLNDCGPYQPYNKWTSLTSLSDYIDAILIPGRKTYINSNSCTATDHVYSQTRVDGVVCQP